MKVPGKIRFGQCLGICRPVNFFSTILSRWSAIPWNWAKINEFRAPKPWTRGCLFSVRNAKFYKGLLVSWIGISEVVLDVHSAFLAEQVQQHKQINCIDLFLAWHWEGTETVGFVNPLACELNLFMIITSPCMEFTFAHFLARFLEPYSESVADQRLNASSPSKNIIWSKDHGRFLNRRLWPVILTNTNNKQGQSP